ncbi:MAG: TolC family protein [Pseudomonadales bacterium]
MTIFQGRGALVCAAFGLSLISSTASAASLSFDQALSLAVEQDRWLTRSELNQSALNARAISAEQLPDPTFRIGLANLATDSFDISQENMTQLQFGISQQFPRGNTLALQRQTLEQRAELEPLSRELRRAQLRLEVGTYWLNGWRAQAKVALIERQRNLFAQLSRVATARYRSGRSERHEVLQVEIAQQRLRERIARFEQLRDQQRGMLYRWLPAASAAAPLTGKLVELPRFDSTESEAQERLLRHPSVLLNQGAVEIAGTAKSLVRQQYKPRWGLSGQYAYRADGAAQRADLASVAVTFSVPLRPALSRDPLLRAATLELEAQRERRALTVRELSGRWHAAQASLAQLSERLKQYDNVLIPKAHERRRAAHQAFASDTADYTQVIEATSDELALKLTRIDVAVDYQQQLLTLQYLLSPAGEQVSSQTRDSALEVARG